MSFWNSLISKEQLLCPICLEVLSQPVSTPCGHNFCMPCIMTYWRSTPLCQCPVCKDVFYAKPQLKVNTFISELTSQFLALSAAEQMWNAEGGACPAGAAVHCDICTDLQQEAASSCLQCLTSYCQLHLEPHHIAAGLKRHTLVEPVANLEDRVCKQHSRLKTRFCKDDMSLLCDLCTGAHPHHAIVSVAQAHKEMSILLGAAHNRARHMVQEQLQKIRTVSESINGSMARTRVVTRKSLQDLLTVVLKIRSGILKLIAELERKQKVADEEAPELFSNLEAEMTVLREAKAKLEDLQQTKDPFQFLKNFPSKSTLPPANDASAFAFSRVLEAENGWKSTSKSVSLLQQLLHSTGTRLTLCSLYLQSTNTPAPAGDAPQAPP